ncbi:MAG: DEAD/DEAH box helicase family protein, partial [Methanosarcinales archaeon]|nr:DEAD/DEAH box helicase family protein [Methanosarcinales archaeon]
MINRFSSRKQKLAESFLNERLVGAKNYDRIAGYFSSSILEIAGENLEGMEGTVRMVCNSQLDERDVKTSRAAHAAMRREWCAAEPENYGSKAKGRFAKLYELLRSGKLEVKVLPDTVFGLIHGKGGVITLQNGEKTSFIGSANETYHAWKLNYELIWEDDSPEAVQWVQEEFDALWIHPDARDLADFVIEDISRIAKREVIQKIEDWREDPEPASSIVELPVYRNDLGLWEHQKYFIKLAFDAHQGPHGARFVLADMVGLGKTLQLAMVAQLIALTGDKPILILAPKTLIWQWQDEMTERLDLPSAVWTGKQWVDEQGIEYPIMGQEGIKQCPRRIGVVSYGLVTKGSKTIEYIKELSYDCIIVDEAHHARRRNLGPNKEKESPEPNNLLSFLQVMGGKSKSILLATATPVQLYPIEAWDLLKILSSGNNESVLGNKSSLWQRDAVRSLDLVSGIEELPEDEMERWNWIRNPLPPSSENRDIEIIRRAFNIGNDVVTVPGSDYIKLREPEKDRVRKLSRDFMKDHNPFIRHIVRRTRKFLENTINDETNEPYLKPIKVELQGEDIRDAIILTTYLNDAYKLAEEFCHLFSKRSRGGGFLKTLLLRRVGSTLYAGKRTSEAMLGIKHENLEAEEEDEDENEDIQVSDIFKEMSIEERNVLQRFLDIISEKEDQDPKYQK